MTLAHRPLLRDTTHRLAWLELDPHALHRNLRQVRLAQQTADRGGGSARAAGIAAVIKADAYGHGLGHIAPMLAPQCDALVVACVGEAVALRLAGIQAPLWVLNGFADRAELADCQHHQLEPVVCAGTHGSVASAGSLTSPAPIRPTTR